MRARFFYGWRIVAACMLAGAIGHGLGLFGAGVYLHELIAANGWQTGFVSGAITLSYVVSALLLIPVGSGISRFGPRPFMASGGIDLAIGVGGIGQVTEPWQAYPAFLAIGVGWSCLSATAVATTLAPWFEKFQGRAISIAMLGASIGGITGAPLLLLGIGRIGLASTTALAGALAIAFILPPAVLVLRTRPQDLGLLPDGLPPDRAVAAVSVRRWARSAALRTTALRTVMVSFGLGMMVQIGFLTHQVPLLAQSLGVASFSMTVSATAVAALVGRIALAQFADRIDARVTAAVVLLLAAGALGLMGLFPVPPVLVGASIVFGATVGNVTTLSPIIVRREFGAPSFGAVFGIASCGIQLAAALGPGFYGLLHDAFGSYRAPLMMAAALDVIAAAVVLFAGRVR
jgi:MFS family permease